MKKIIILIPVYNDWQSLNKLLVEINHEISEIENVEFHCIVINDASTSKISNIQKPNNLKVLKIINLKKNQGHARCNALGLRFIIKNENCDYVILMDGDGEDRPAELKILVKKMEESKNVSVVAKRIKRSEGILFKFLYELHKFITFIFTGQKIHFGNYSCLAFKDVEKISSKPSLWSSFSGTLKKYISPLEEINSIRGLRYFGPSQMSLFKLGIHSFAIMAVFKNTVYLRTIIILALLLGLQQFVDIYWVIISIFLVLFNFLIFVVSRRENLDELLLSEDNIDKINIL